ncbi:NADH dehydrogenase subunit H [Halopolyspora algeriensis]|uniref:NADH-quinone oxidoreductase subunit H n=1 Tax=Halopolyspora algeriensis TaxID=1500506 RepID=A0A368VY29_9ACTN|nr:NADH-quinone oxidoreductase subunit NuoH [Halopolyspora algeriensis]RCW46861.1 NADH dehydrogenase subunit H [Halopolyspora algeriensis]TQM47952.1 NADH dehydrogenase subunit H [Halopolyspora algeriensis]
MTETARLLADDPIWLVLIKVVGTFAFLVLMTLLTIWAERRVIGRMQHRPGPNRAGPFGILQSLADGLKLAFKEDIRPVLADKWIYILAPVISATPALVAFSVMPIAPRVTLFGEETALQLVELPVGLLVVLAAAAIGVYGIVLAGWSSGSPYPLLGSLRSAAQVISYEIAMGLSFVAVIMYSGTLSTAGIVEAQEGGWFFALLPFSFAVYVIAMVGETNRAPFDLPEAESELVGGFHTEYSSLKFALFFLAEYINMVTVSALATTLFLGGWHAPWPLSLIGDGVLNTGWWPALWFLLKTIGFLFLFVWLRATLPRLRYDQFMNLGWKVLIPLSLVWICAVTVIRGLRNAEAVSAQQFLLIGGGAIAVLLVAAFLIPDRPPQEPEEPQAPLSGGGYPVPPLDLQVPQTPRRRTPVSSGASVAEHPQTRSPEGDEGGNSSTKEAPDGSV